MNPNGITPDPAAICAWLSLLFSEAPGRLVIWDSASRRSATFVTADLAEAAAETARRAEHGSNVYFGCGLQAAELPPEERGSVGGVLAIPGAWLDLDVASPAHEGNGCYPPTEADAMALLDEFPLRPTAIIGSGHGLQVWWLFCEPWILVSDEERSRASAFLRRFQGTMRVHARAHGWTLDATHDLARVLRAPGTVNRKPTLPAVPVTLQRINPELKYDPEDFEPYLLVEEEQEEPHAPPDGEPEKQADDDDLLRRAREARNGEKFAALFDRGDLSAYSGDDSRADAALLAHLAFWTGKDARRMDRLFRRSALFRPKWDTPRGDGTYGSLSIAKAIRATRETYSTPGRRAPSSPPPPYEPFPVHVLPDVPRAWILAASAALGIDPAYVAVPLLAILAAAIGNTYVIQLKPGWTEPAILWGIILGRSGTLKSPALRTVMKAVYRRQEEALRRHAENVKEYEAAMIKYEAALKDFRAKRSFRGDPPEKPEEPPVPQYVVGDTTVEKLATILRDSPRGVLLERDELSGWIRSFDLYKANGRGADVAHWLSMYSAEPLKVDRKTGDRKDRTIFVPRAAVNITGAIIPAIFAKALGVENFVNGLASRFFLAMPPTTPPRWTEATVPAKTALAMDSLLDRLFALDLAEPVDVDGPEVPNVVTLSPEAKGGWVEFYNDFGGEIDGCDENQAAAASKTIGRAARLALILHVAEAVGAGKTIPPEVEERTINAGITLARWGLREAERVYAALGETAADRERRALVEWIQARGGAVTVREVAQGHRRFRGPGGMERAEQALEALVKAGLGTWESQSGTRGPAARVFRVSAPSTSTGFKEHGRKVKPVDVDGPQDSEMREPGDESEDGPEEGEP